MATIEELKEIIINLKMDIAYASVPKNHCPDAHYPDFTYDWDCSKMSCEECHRIFFEKYKEKITQEVQAL